jgi:hypothetical protein
MQKVYYYQTPEILSAINAQKAVNVHNIRFFHYLSRIVMVGISLWAMIAPYAPILEQRLSALPLKSSRLDLFYGSATVLYFYYCYFVVEAYRDCMRQASSEFKPCLVTWNQQEVCELFVYVILVACVLRSLPMRQTANNGITAT